MNGRNEKNVSPGRRAEASFGLPTTPSVLRRLRLARRAGARKELIASATVVGDYLFAWSCEPLLYVAPINRFPALARLPKAELGKFRVSASGSHLHWTRGDVDLDLEAIRRHAVTILRSAQEFREKRAA